jgi:type III secretion protein S
MNTEFIIGLASEGLLLSLLVSLPVILTSSVLGLGVAFLQAITSVQEGSISQSIKLILVGVVVVVAAPWGGSTVLAFAQSAVRAIANVGV